MKILLLLPIIVPLGAAALSVLIGGRRRWVRQCLGVFGAVGQLAAAVILLVRAYLGGSQATQIGGWPVPLGISIVADPLGSLMVVVTSVVGVAVVLFSLGSMDERREQKGYYGLVLLLLAAAAGSFLTGDLFNLFVWFEVLLISSFVLMSLGMTRKELEGALKYVVLSLVGSALFLSGIAVVYGLSGTLNFADLASTLPVRADATTRTVASALFLFAFGTKAAVFPLFFWLPASYHTPPVAVGALFAGVLTKVGVYALLRTFTAVFPVEDAFSRELLLGVGVVTMITGVLGAVAQSEIRRLLSFHVISQVGYLVAGIGLFSRAALAATIAFTVHVIFAKAALFLVGGIAERLTGTSDLKRMGGLYASRPFLAALFLVPALSLAGIPPFSGFFAKFSLVRAALEQRAWVVAAVAVLVGILTLYSMIKIWREAFWKSVPAEDGPSRRGKAPPVLVLGCILLSLWSVALGMGAGPFFEFTSQAATQLLDMTRYNEAIQESSR
jgi:multicomponent Na+:H+ antiporter subunit D